MMQLRIFFDGPSAQRDFEGIMALLTYIISVLNPDCVNNKGCM